MKSTFYDVKLKQKVEAKATGKKTFDVKGSTRYALTAQTEDGRNLTKFVSRADYDGALV